MKSLKLFPFLFLLAACTGGAPKYDATGTFEATEVIVSAEASGRLLSFDIEEGTTLKDGQEVGIIDTVQLYLKKLQLEASVKSVEGQRPDILKQVAATRDRVSNLLRVGAANQKQLDDAESLLEVLRKQLDAQNSTLRNSDRSLTWQSSSVGIQVAQIEDQLRKCHITSPLTGTVLAKYAEAGELAAPGTPLFKVADMEQIYLRAYGRCGQDIAFPHPHHLAACRRRLGFGLRPGCGEGLQSHPQAGGVYARTLLPLSGLDGRGESQFLRHRFPHRHRGEL